MIVVVSWAGRWYAKYHRDADSTLSLTAGQDKTHFKLLPGETVRTPMIVLQFWKGGNWVDAQNRWRQWMIRCNIPRPGGKNLALPLFAACSSHQFAEMTKANEQNQKEFIDSYLQKGLKINYWWMDAGWYVDAAEKGWPWTGTWEVDRSPNRFPNGLRAISDYAHSKNVKTIVWFEPERVAAGTWLATEHPDWILGGAGGGLLNLGNPDAWNWLVSHIDKIITDEGIDLYRQDYNIDPLEYWQKNDPADRQGITENKYVMGYLAYWDELLRRHPGMLIDSCASGGHRNDLETMRRSIPLLRSDYLFEPVGQQAHTYGLSFWLPVHGTAYNPSNTQGWGWGTGQGLLAYGPYIRRSNMCPANTGCFDFRAAVDETLIMALYQEWLDIAPNYWGDYYPLTDYTLSQKDWIAWQFHRPDSKAGFVQAFRHDQSIHPSAQLRLLGLKPDKTYLLNNYNTKTQSRMTGKQLMEEGLVIELKNKPDATTIGYREE
jgi:alpha-galactosidase